MIKGQNLRVLYRGSCVAAATSCTINVTANTEETSTKDSTGNWTEEECVSKSWDITSESLIETIDDLDIALEVGETVVVAFQQTKGLKNREKESSIFTGTAIITNVSITAANKQNGTKSVSFKGISELIKPAE